MEHESPVFEDETTLKNFQIAKEKKSYVKPLLLVHGDLDTITQCLCMGPSDGCCGTEGSGAAACAS